MTSFFTKDTQKTDRTLCVCSVTSYAVTASVVRVLHHEGVAANPVVLFSCEEKIPAYHDHDPEVLDQVTLVHVKYALERCRSFQGRIDMLVCTIGEPWLVTYLRSAHLERAEPFKVLQSTVDDVVTREKRLFEQEILQNYTEGDAEMGIVDISRPVIVMNGYVVEKLSPIPARTLDVHLSISMAPVSFFEDLVGTYVDVFHRTDIVFQSADIAQTYAALGPEKVAVLDVGGITSSLSVIEDHRTLYHAVLPAGLIDLEEGLKDIFGMKSLHLSSLMHLAADERVLDHERGYFTSKIGIAAQPFVETVGRGIVDLKKYAPNMPSTLFIVGGRGWLSMVRPGVQGVFSSSVSVMHSEALVPSLTFARGASSESAALSLAILQAVKTLFE